MKKTLATFFALALIFQIAISFAVPVHASGEAAAADTQSAAQPETESETEAKYHHVLDAEGLLKEEDIQKTEESAKTVLQKNGVDLFVYVTSKTIKDPDDTGSGIYSANATTDAGVCLMLDKKKAYTRAYGRAASIFSKDDLKNIVQQTIKQKALADKALTFVSLTGESLTEKGVLPIPEGRQKPRLVDDAGLLSQEETYSLCGKLDSISEKRQLDVIVVTNNSLDGKDIESYADDYYDYNGYGFGENDDGILLLLSMDTREWAMTTYGKAIDIFTDDIQNDISDSFLSYLSDGDYFGGFTRFADLCDSQIERYNESGGSRYYGKEPFGWFMAIGGSLLIGLGVGLIVALALRSQLTSVKPQETATAYTKPGSLKLTEKNDLYLYHTITRVARPKESSSSGSGSRSSGHSSTHVSSSGRSHGGSHGHF